MALVAWRNGCASQVVAIYSPLRSTGGNSVCYFGAPALLNGSLWLLQSSLTPHLLKGIARHQSSFTPHLLKGIARYHQCDYSNRNVENSKRQTKFKSMTDQETNSVVHLYPSLSSKESLAEWAGTKPTQVGITTCPSLTGHWSHLNTSPPRTPCLDPQSIPLQYQSRGQSVIRNRQMRELMQDIFHHKAFKFLFNIYFFRFSSISLYQKIEYSSLCYTVSPCCLSTLYIIVCIYHSQTPHPSPLYTPLPWQPQVCFLQVCLFGRSVHLCHIFDATYKWYHMVFVFLSGSP